MIYAFMFELHGGISPDI